MTTKEFISAYRKLTQWLREQLVLDNYQEGDPINTKDLAMRVISNKQKDLTSIVIIRFCWQFTLKAIARTVVKKPRKNEETDEDETENDAQPTFEFYVEMNVPDPFIQLLLDFGDKRFYDILIGDQVCLYKAVLNKDTKQVQRGVEHLGRKTQELDYKTKALQRIADKMIELYGEE
jgi:hypothetical protein